MSSNAVFYFQGQIIKDVEQTNLGVAVFPVYKVCFIWNHSLTAISKGRELGLNKLSFASIQLLHPTKCNQDTAPRAKA